MVDIRIAGIPARAEVLNYWPADPGCTVGPADFCYPPEPEEVVFRLLDRKGNLAPWLEAKAEREGFDIQEEVLDRFRETSKESA